MKKLILLIVACVAVSFAAAQNPGIQGTWRVLKLGGKEVPNEYSFVKIYNATHFAWQMADSEGNIIIAAGGRCTFDGKTLSETFDRVMPGTKEAYGQTFVSGIIIDGNRLNLKGNWQGEEEVEVWERIR